MLQNTENFYLGGNSKGKFKGKDKETSKYNRVAKIQQNYQEIDSKLREFCSVKGITERKACAFAVLIILETGVRIGNEDSAEGYVSKAKKTEGQTLQTYGLTTLLKKHVSFLEIDGKLAEMSLDFVGKKSVDQYMTITDPFLVEIGKQFYDHNDERLEDRWLTNSDGTEINKMDVHRFVKKSIGNGFSPKDFRAFRANVEAAKLSNSILSWNKNSKSVAKKDVNNEIKSIVTDVSKVLGNTPAIAKKAYINPEILRKHWTERGYLVEVISRKGKKKEIISKEKI
jgi:DNA topoisomerase-1